MEVRQLVGICGTEGLTSQLHPYCSWQAVRFTATRSLIGLPEMKAPPDYSLFILVSPLNALAWHVITALTHAILWKRLRYAHVLVLTLARITVCALEPAQVTGKKVCTCHTDDAIPWPSEPVWSRTRLSINLNGWSSLEERA